MIKKVEIQDQILNIEGFECMCAVTGYENSCSADPDSTSISVDGIVILYSFDTEDSLVIFGLEQSLYSDFNKYSNIIEERIN